MLLTGLAVNMIALPNLDASSDAMQSLQRQPVI